MAREGKRAELIPGVVAGLAWTETGGEVLYVEAVMLPEGKDLTLTGQLGERDAGIRARRPELHLVAGAGTGHRRPN